MEIIKSTSKKDCIFYRNDTITRGCKILEELVCKKSCKCSFYKKGKEVDHK